uniref:Ig-like domain-containing protein n=1 Tax=Myotis lucifugus TaxID=59463 RepID=L7N191_MYOLU
MEFPAASASRGLVPWLGLLMAVFLLTIWIPPTTARFDMVMTSAVEGQDVILCTQNRPPNVTGFIWYRGFVMNYTNLIAYVSWSSGQYIKGPKYTRRETVKFNGSLIIRNVTMWDLGFYIRVAVLNNSKTEKGFGLLIVYRPESVPTLLASNTTVTDNEDAEVPDEIFINWLFIADSLRLKERMKLSRTRTLTIDAVRREDAWNYQCKVSNPISCTESAPVELDLLFSYDSYGYNPPISTYRIDSNVSFRCSTPQNPPLQETTLLTDGWPLEDTGSLIIRKVTLKDTGTYTVIAVLQNSLRENQITLRTIRVRAEIFEPTLLANNTTVTENEDAVVITCYTDESSTNWLFNAMSVQLRESMKLSQDHRTLTVDPIRREDAGNYQCKDSNPISSTESAPVELDVK